MPTSNPEAAARRYFTVAEANRALPLVQKIVTDIVRQFQVVGELHSRLEAITSRTRKRQTGDPYLEEVAQTEAEKDAEEARLGEYIEELTRLGVELKGPDGLCDFPSLRDGREIYLCWRLGEPEVMHWHEIHTGFAGRQPLEPSLAVPQS